MSTKFTYNQIMRAFRAQNGGCMYCEGATWHPRFDTKSNAMIRLGIPAEASGSTKMLRLARATREHLIRSIDGGTDAGKNIKMACQFCNTTRLETPVEQHRANMQRLVAAGLHPVNRPAIVESPIRHIRLGLKMVREMRDQLVEPA